MLVDLDLHTGRDDVPDAAALLGDAFPLMRRLGGAGVRLRVRVHVGHARLRLCDRDAIRSALGRTRGLLSGRRAGAEPYNGGNEDHRTHCTHTGLLFPAICRPAAPYLDAIRMLMSTAG